MMCTPWGRGVSKTPIEGHEAAAATGKAAGAGAVRRSQGRIRPSGIARARESAA
jgi:hypothetical protein